MSIWGSEKHPVSGTGPKEPEVTVWLHVLHLCDPRCYLTVTSVLKTQDVEDFIDLCEGDFFLNAAAE